MTNAAQILGRTMSDRPTGPAVQGIVVSLLFFVAFGGWLATAPLSGAVIGPAVIRVESHRQAVQHIDGGTVREILVREGERVEAQQILLRLDDVTLRSNAEVFQSQKDSLLALEARLIAERDGLAQMSIPPELAERVERPDVRQVIAGQEQLFETRRRMLLGQMEVFRKRISQSKEQLRGFESQLVSAKQQMAIAVDERGGLAQLLEKGFVARTRVLALDREVAGLGGRVGDLVSAIAAAREQIGGSEAEIERLAREREAEIAQTLRTTQGSLGEVTPKLGATLEALGRVELRAPRAGWVVALSVFNRGAVIRGGDRVLDIIPFDSPLVVESRIRPEDVDEVRTGMRAEIRLTGLNQRITPVVGGQIVSISADRMVDVRSGDAYFEVMAWLDETEVAPFAAQLVSGMPALAMYPTVERTPLSYLLKPLLDGYDRALRD